MIKFASVLAVLVAACTDVHTTPPPGSQWSLSQLGAGDLRASGIAANPNTGNLWLLARGTGLVESTPQGQWVSTIPYDATFVDRGFTDLAVLGDGSFALAASGEGYHYDRVHETEFFCLVPGDGSTLENQALTFDPASGAMYVAPAYFDFSHNVVSAQISAYASSDGHHMTDVDVKATDVIAQGIAVDDESGRMWIVENDKLYRFTMGGIMEAQATLSGVSEAAGVTLFDGKLYVLDGAAQAIRIFDRAGLNQ